MKPSPKSEKKRQRELKLREKVKAELIFEQLEGSGHVYCTACRKLPDWRGIDLSHIVALSQGGKTTKENTLLLCRDCHEKKHHIGG